MGLATPTCIDGTTVISGTTNNVLTGSGNVSNALG